jgi:hypothetical protein
LHLIKKFKLKPGEFGAEIELELHDSQKALELLGKHHKLFTDKFEMDWRRELDDVGIDPDAAVNEFAEKYKDLLRAQKTRTGTGAASGA